jgi:hypothetical protein
MLERHPRASVRKIAQEAGVSGEFVRTVADLLDVGLPVNKVVRHVGDIGFGFAAYAGSPVAGGNPPMPKPKRQRKPPIRLPKAELISTNTGRLVRYRAHNDNVILVEKRDAFTIVSWTARCSARGFVKACSKLPGIDQEPNSGILAIRGVGNTTGTIRTIFDAVAEVPPKKLRFTCDFVRLDTRSFGAAYQDMHLGALSSEKQRIVSFVSRGAPRVPFAPLVRRTAPARLADLVLLARDNTPVH